MRMRSWKRTRFAGAAATKVIETARTAMGVRQMYVELGLIGGDDNAEAASGQSRRPDSNRGPLHYE